MTPENEWAIAIGPIGVINAAATQLLKAAG